MEETLNGCPAPDSIEVSAQWQLRYRMRCLRAVHCCSLLMRRTFRHLPAKVVCRFHILSKCAAVLVRPAMRETRNTVSNCKVCGV